MDLPPSPDRRTGWRRFLTDPVLRVLAAIGVVAAAGVVVPTLTSQPRRDEEAVRAIEERAATSIDLGEDTADASLELPSELTTVPATDRPSRGRPSATTAPGDPGDGSTTTTQVTSSTTPGASTPTSSASSVATVTSTSTTRVPSGSCALSREAGAEREVAALFEERRPDMRRSTTMDAAARTWACEMAGRQVAEHMSPWAVRAQQLMDACGGCSSVAENVAFNSSAAAAWQAWLASATHLGNIDAPGGGTYGVAAYRNGANLYFVHVFGR